MSVVNLFGPECVRVVGWTVLHFLWQGAGLALLLSIFLANCRTASKRYGAGVITLAAMAAAPVLTFTRLWQSVVPATRIVPSPGAMAGNLATIANTHASSLSVPQPLWSENWLVWPAALWFFGVLLFGIRAVGGWILLQRLYRSQRQALAPLLASRYRVLAGRLGITSKVRFYVSDTSDAPAVIGWFRPMILLPLTAFTGLPPEQLEAIIIHELAHIKRLDCFVNLFQIGIETMLFYHPAVWWVSSLIRVERENCCDDIAVSACGDVGVYARALTALESWRVMPTSLLVAANSSPLRARVERLLGLRTMASNVFGAGTAAVSIICATGMLLAGTTFRPEPSNAIALPAPATYLNVAYPDSGSRSMARGVLLASAQAPPPPASAQPDPPKKAAAAPSYIEGLRAAGLRDMSVDELIALKVHGVTSDYVRAIHATGLTPLVAELLAMKIQGVTPEYIRKVRDTWPHTDIGEIVAMKIQGVTVDDAATFGSLGVHGFDVGELIAFRIQGITPDYVRALQAAGFTDLRAGDIIAAKEQGITPEFIQKAREHGLTKLTLQQVIALKNSDVF